MFFLVRVAFWLTVVLVLLPSGSSQKGAQAAKFGTTDAVVAAGAAVSDMSNFCERQPAACEVGAQAAVAIGQRAQAGAMMVYEFINERVARGSESGRGGAQVEHGGETGSVSKVSVIPMRMVQTVPASQNTLTSSDLEPAWQGPPVRTETVPLPRPRKPPRHKA